MTVTLLAYIKKLPNLSHAEFKAIAENEHMPTMNEIAGDVLPKMTRYYVDSTQPAFRGSAPDHDCIVRMEFESEEALQKMHAHYQDPDVYAKAIASQKKFMIVEEETTFVINEIKA
ncbi:MAG: hypothetical protein Q9162_007226 [Coniocarpon cinnabarinum]